MTWRYLVFRWNDSEVEVDAAIALSRLYEVDAFCLYLTHLPDGAASYRLAPGTPSFQKYRDYISTVHDYQHPCPGADGFYHDENLPNLGFARWTSLCAHLATSANAKAIGSVSQSPPRASDRAAGQGHSLCEHALDHPKNPATPYGLAGGRNTYSMGAAGRDQISGHDSHLRLLVSNRGAAE